MLRGEASEESVEPFDLGVLGRITDVGVAVLGARRVRDQHETGAVPRDVLP